MKTWGLICLSLFFITIPAYAQVANTEIGGPIVPKVNNTVTQYCWNGICQTSKVITLNNINDTGKEIKTKYNIIMIIPSELCTNAIKNHLKTDCPSLDKLIKYDNSNQKISGYFYSKDGSILERSNPQVKNHWQYYAYYNHTTICVYCTGNYLTTDLYKTIIIQQSHSFEYASHSFTAVKINIPQYSSSNGNFTNITYTQNELNAGLTTFLNRQVIGCNTATIAYSDQLLNDTINYLKSDCKTTKLNMTNSYSSPKNPWQWNNPFSSLHYKAAVEQVKTKHPGNCMNGQCSFTTSTKKPGW